LNSAPLYGAVNVVRMDDVGGGGEFV